MDQNPSKNMIRSKPRPLRTLLLSSGIYLSVLIVVGVFLGGIELGRRQGQAEARKTGTIINKNAPAPLYLSKDVDMAQFWKVWEAVRTSYLRQPIKDPTLFYGSIKGLVASLGDPYSVYFDPDEAATFSSQLEGAFEGIGAEIGYRNDQLIVLSPLPGTPAAKAGLKSGDAILKINSEDTTDMAVDIAVMKIRGPKGTSVTLNIGRQGVPDVFDVKIARARIVVDSVKSEMIDDAGKEIPRQGAESASSSGGIALITVNEFNQDTVSGFDSAIRAMSLRSAKGFIIDLRGDPGGYLDAAVELPRDWVGKNPIVIQRKSDGTETPMSPTGKIAPIDLPTVILVDKWSASAAEIVTGAFQDYGKATIVGETTFGKGSVQEYVDDFPDGSALKLTTAEWLTPKKQSIDKKGLEPDVAVSISEEDIKAGRDPQLLKAIEIINQKLDASKTSKNTQ
jgi:carboxyl-terminal processing protease